MDISRSGYYKWIKNIDKMNQHEKDRIELSELIIKWHKKKPSYGYHRIAAKIREELGWLVSDNLVHKICKLLKITSNTKHYKYVKMKEKEEHKIYPKLVRSWKVSRPFEIVVSDGTVISFKGQKYDWNFHLPYIRLYAHNFLL